MNDKTIDFLNKAIIDTQGVIKAIDIKAGFLFVILTLPLTKLGQIYGKCEFLYYKDPWWLVLIILFCVTWFLAFFSLFKTLYAQSNPSQFVDACGASGCFYGHDLFTFNFFDVFLNFRNNAKRNVDKECDLLPTNEEDVIKELVFEKIKLAYIRDIKMKRINFCILLTFIWIVFGFIVWTINIISH
jgi:hypothetical protein